jgi:hypothetical protein
MWVVLCLAALAYRQAQSAEPTLYRLDCQTVSPRVPGILGTLPWLAELPPDEHLFSGEAIPSSPVDSGDGAEPPDESTAWMLTGGIHLVLREIDLDGDGRCDLVGTARTAISTGGDSVSHLVFWFATPAGWRRDGVVQTVGGLDPMARELLGPQNPADHARYGFGSYVPARLDRGRVVLAARPSHGREQVDPGPVTLLAFDGRRGGMVPLPNATQAARIDALAERVCVHEQSEDEACMTWLE